MFHDLARDAFTVVARDDRPFGCKDIDSKPPLSLSDENLVSVEYAERNGNVYKRDSDGNWQSRSRNSWDDVVRTQPVGDGPDRIPGRRDTTTRRDTTRDTGRVATTPERRTTPSTYGCAGGAVARVKEVDVKEVQIEPSESSSEVVLRTKWTATGTVGYWGHIHTRRNLYSALLTLTPMEGLWKISKLQLLSEERVVLTGGLASASATAPGGGRPRRRAPLTGVAGRSCGTNAGTST